MERPPFLGEWFSFPAPTVPTHQLQEKLRTLPRQLLRLHTRLHLSRAFQEIHQLLSCRRWIHLLMDQVRLRGTQLFTHRHCRAWRMEGSGEWKRLFAAYHYLDRMDRVVSFVPFVPYTPHRSPSDLLPAFSCMEDRHLHTLLAQAPQGHLRASAAGEPRRAVAEDVVRHRAVGLVWPMVRSGPAPNRERGQGPSRETVVAVSGCP